MNWNWRAVRAIIRKDLVQVLRNKAIVLPMILVPLILLVLMPLVFVLLPQLVPAEELNVDDLQGLLQVLPPTIRAEFEGMTAEQVWVTLSTNYTFAPMFLVVPLMVSVIVASDSFVGERERKTLEALLYTPISDLELFVAKVLTALLPAVAIATAAFILYGVVVNAAGYSMMGGLFFPAAPWWPMVFWLGPAVSLAGVGATVLISSKAKTFMQAQQTSGALVLPVVLLMAGQLAGVFFLGVGLTLILGLIVMLVGALLVWIGARTFSRGELIARV